MLHPVEFSSSLAQRRTLVVTRARTFWMSVMSVSLMTLFLLEEPDLELELSKHRWLRRQGVNKQW